MKLIRHTLTIFCGTEAVAFDPETMDSKPKPETVFKALMTPRPDTAKDIDSRNASRTFFVSTFYQLQTECARRVIPQKAACKTA